MSQGLTTRQADVLALLRDAERTPSYREIRDMLGIASISSIGRTLEDLEEKGYIERLPGRARAFRVKPEPTSWDLSLADFRTAVLVAELERRGLRVAA